MTEPRRPDFFIVGAPKCGTSAMYEYLRQHPDLYLPARKELRYFGRDLEIRDRRALTADEYLGYFSAAPPGARIGTAYVWYLYSRSAAREIAEFNPAAQIIVMLRNPLDMLPALHAEHLFNGNEDIADFTEALEAEPDRRAGRRIPPHAHLPQGLYYSEVPSYAEQLERYFSALGRERVHVIIYDDFARSPEATYRETLQFLEVADEFTPESFDVVNPRKRLRSEWLRHFLARPPSVPRYLIRHLVPAPIRRTVHERAKRLNVVPVSRPPLPAATRERIHAMFADEIAELSRLIGRDLSMWDTAAPADSTLRLASP